MEQYSHQLVLISKSELRSETIRMIEAGGDCEVIGVSSSISEYIGQFGSKESPPDFLLIGLSALSSECFDEEAQLLTAFRDRFPFMRVDLLRKSDEYVSEDSGMEGDLIWPYMNSLGASALLDHKD